MKLTVLQIVLGTLIVIAAVCIGAWMIFGVDALLTETVADESGAMIINVSPEHNALFAIARYIFILLLAAGATLLLSAASLTRRKVTKKAATMHIATGVLTVAVSIFVLRWGYVLEFRVPVEGGIMLYMAYARLLTVVIALLGLAVNCTGVAQLLSKDLRK